MDNIRINLIFFSFFVGGALYSIVFSKLSRMKWLKYLPTIIGTGAIGYLWFMGSFTNMDGFASLAYFVMSLFIFVLVAGNFLTNIFFSVMKKRKEKQLPQNEPKEEESKSFRLK